jgi:hypothetical protein
MIFKLMIFINNMNIIIIMIMFTGIMYNRWLDIIIILLDNIKFHFHACIDLFYRCFYICIYDWILYLILRYLTFIFYDVWITKWLLLLMRNAKDKGGAFIWSCGECVVTVLWALEEVVLKVWWDELDDIGVDVCKDAEMNFFFEGILSANNANIDGIFMLLEMLFIIFESRLSTIFNKQIHDLEVIFKNLLYFSSMGNNNLIELDLIMN